MGGRGEGGGRRGVAYFLWIFALQTMLMCSITSNVLTKALLIVLVVRKREEDTFLLLIFKGNMCVSKRSYDTCVP